MVVVLKRFGFGDSLLGLDNLSFRRSYGELGFGRTGILDGWIVSVMR